MLQQALDESEGTPNLPASRWTKEGGVNAPNPELACPKGVTAIRPVKPPTAKPASAKAPQQHMICFVCGGLITGIFGSWDFGDKLSLRFLDAFSHLYKRVCPSVCPSVGHTRVEIVFKSRFVPKLR